MILYIPIIQYYFSLLSLSSFSMFYSFYCLVGKLFIFTPSFISIVFFHFSHSIYSHSCCFSSNFSSYCHPIFYDFPANNFANFPRLSRILLYIPPILFIPVLLALIFRTLIAAMFLFRLSSSSSFSTFALFTLLCNYYRITKYH